MEWNSSADFIKSPLLSVITAFAIILIGCGNGETDQEIAPVQEAENEFVSIFNCQLMHELVDQSLEAHHQGIIAFQLHSGPPMRVELRNID